MRLYDEVEDLGFLSPWSLLLEAAERLTVMASQSVRSSPIWFVIRRLLGVAGRHKVWLYLALARMTEIRSRYELGNLKPHVVQGTGNPIMTGGRDAAQRTIVDLGAGHAKPTRPRD